MCVWRMWGSGTQQSATWGWPPPLNSYNEQDYDPSQGWAEAAALWAQQRQMREQYQNGNDPNASTLPPPPPPGPPPLRPTLPPVEHPPLDVPLQPIVHDYMHGKIQPTEIIDYQHGKSFNVSPASIQNNVQSYEHAQGIDYAHGTTNSQSVNNTQGVEDAGQDWEVNSDNWFESYHPSGQEFYNGGWNQEGWNGDQAQYYAAAAQYYQNEYANATPPAPASSMDASVKSGRHSRSDSYVSSNHHSSSKHKQENSSYQRHSSSSTDHNKTQSGQDDGETAKRKVLPLWLRQGLEKMEQEKKKALERSKAMEKKSLAKKKFDNEDNSESEQEMEVKKQDNETASSSKSKDENEGKDSQTSESEADLEDEEVKYQQMMMKVKSWMTEILLGVTNKEIRNVCSEVYFEFKRSLKVKATQVRRSGGLDALRSAGVDGDGNITPSESEDEQEDTKTSTVLPESLSPKKDNDLEQQRQSSPNSAKTEIISPHEVKSDSKVESGGNSDTGSNKAPTNTTPTLSKKNVGKTGKKLPKKYSSSHSDNDSDSSVDLSPTMQKPAKRIPAAYRSISNPDDTNDERLKYFKMLMEQSKKELLSTSEENNDSDEDSDALSDELSESEELSSDSEEEVRRIIKSKKRHKTAAIRNKKSKRKRKNSSSDDSVHRKKKKRKNNSSSSDESIRRIKKKSSSSKKKRYRKSKSPVRSKKKR